MHPLCAPVTSYCGYKPVFSMVDTHFFYLSLAVASSLACAYLEIYRMGTFYEFTGINDIGTLCYFRLKSISEPTFIKIRSAILP